MNLRNLFIVSVFSLMHASIVAAPRTLLENEVTIGFLFGYVTGLVPIAGQAVFPILVELGRHPSNGYDEELFVGSALAGHVAGIATISTLACCACRCTGRLIKGSINRLRG